jgi:hypothetical protein
VCVPFVCRFSVCQVLQFCTNHSCLIKYSLFLKWDILRLGCQ